MNNKREQCLYGATRKQAVGRAPTSGSFVQLGYYQCTISILSGRARRVESKNIYTYFKKLFKYGRWIY